MAAHQRREDACRQAERLRIRPGQSRDVDNELDELDRQLRDRHIGVQILLDDDCTADQLALDEIWEANGDVGDEAMKRRSGGDTPRRLSRVAQAP